VAWPWADAPMTKTTTELYCSRCQCTVTAIKSLINYHCPKCGATFMASQVEREPKESEKIELPQSVAG
jgi:predicted RNA-binding Zn-ribbon protein involved in translation (DUF1610 family)